MSTTTVEEFVTKINQLPDVDRTELIRRLNQSPPGNGEPKKSTTKLPKAAANPNLVWIKKNKAKYAGNYVALKGGQLIAFGRTIREADQGAKAKGVTNPLLHYILPADYVPWGGW